MAHSRDDVSQAVCDAVLVDKRVGTPQCVSILVDLSMVDAKWQTDEVARLAAPQHARVFHPHMRFGEALHIESLGGGIWEAAVALVSARPADVMDLSKAAR